MSIFGHNLDNSFLRICLASKVQVITNIEKGICRLKMSDWEELETLNEKERCIQIAHEQMMAIK